MNYNKVIKISIVIPMYNVEKYINKCLLSTFNQGFTENEFEIIAVDDGSPDDSLNLVKEISKEHSNIHIISQKNKGLGGARNTGIQKARGEYLLFLDADDIINESTLKKVLMIAKKNDLDILEFGANGIDANDKLIYHVSFKKQESVLSGIEYYNNFKSLNSACNKLYKRKFLIENNLLFIEKIYGEDFEFNTRAIYLANNMMCVNHTVSNFLWSENSITRSQDIEKKKKYLNDLINVLRRINAFKNTFENDNEKGHNRFFRKRMTVINIDIFYLMFNNNFTFSDILKVKKTLKNERIFRVTNSINDFKKDIFRIVFLNFKFSLFKIIIMLKR